MSGHPVQFWQLVLSIMFAALLATVPADWFSIPARAADGCTTNTDDGVRSSTCRLVDGQPVEGQLGGPGSSLMYRVDAMTPETVLSLRLSATGGSTKVAVTDWRGDVLGTALRADAAPDVTLTVTLPLPGAYGVTVSGDAPASSPTFQLQPAISSPTAPSRAIWPPLLHQPDGLLTGERQVIRTPRGGSPSAGVAVARALGSPSDSMVGDFKLVSDIRFERIVGPSAFTVRFRYEPEAGGGTGYVLSIDPFGGVASLDSFDEGQRRAIVTHRPLPTVPTSEQPSRLIVQATGPNIIISLDGLPVLETTDDRFQQGLIAVGVVTWSDPVIATFDHLQVTTLDP